MQAPQISLSESLMVQTNTTLQYKSLAREHIIQQWRQFLCSSINKTSLINVLVGEWTLQRCRYMLEGIVCNLRRNLLQYDSRLMGGNGGAAVYPIRKQAPICFCMHCMLQELVRMQSQPKTPMSRSVVLLSKRKSPVPSIRSGGHGTAHGLSTSANWYGHWETAYVTA